MSEIKHTPTPWKVVSTPHFDSGLVYTSIQPVTVDEEAMKPLAMMNGEYHVCRMSHTAAEWRFNYHRANAAFIVTAVNAYDKQRALIETLSKTLSAVKTWAEQRCPCDNDEPNPCPLCGASVENLEACKAVDQTFPPSIKRDIFAALAAAKEITR